MLYSPGCVGYEYIRRWTGGGVTCEIVRDVTINTTKLTPDLEIEGATHFIFHKKNMDGLSRSVQKALMFLCTRRFPTQTLP